MGADSVSICRPLAATLARSALKARVFAHPRGRRGRDAAPPPPIGRHWSFPAGLPPRLLDLVERPVEIGDDMGLNVDPGGKPCPTLNGPRRSGDGVREGSTCRSKQ